MLLWSRGMHLWQICHPFFPRQPFNFQSDPEKLQSLVSPRKLFSCRGKKLSWQNWSFLVQIKVFSRIPKKKYSGICLKWSLDALNTVLTPLVEICAKIPEFLRPNSENRFKKNFFGKKFILLKLFLWVHGLHFCQLHHTCCSILQSNNFAHRVRKVQIFDFYQKFVPRNVPLDT